MLAAAALTAAQQPGQPLVALPGGEAGALRTQAKCIACHEIGHTTRSRLSRAEWEDTMEMMKKRGAQFTDDDVKVIVDYLVVHYGPEGPPAAARPLSAALATNPTNDPQALLERHTCAGCHAVDKRIVGPALQEVAQRYRGDTDASAKLIEKIRQGGAGVWGNVPMPPFPDIPAHELNVIAAYVLSLR